MRSLWIVLFASVSLVVATGCTAPDYGSTLRHGVGSSTASNDPTAADAQNAEGDDGDDATSDHPLVSSADESKPGVPSGAGFAGGATTAEATENLNLREGPSTSDAVLAIIPQGTAVDLLSSSATNGYLNVTYNGITGWAHSAYLVSIVTNGGSSGAPDTAGPASPDNAIARAQSAMGFSYNWGRSAWLESGPTSSTRGYCAGACPSCSHHGQYGADCSGLVARAWQFGDPDLSVDSHPYNTGDFVHDSTGHWQTVTREAMQSADALVYRSGNHGHIALYEKGDAWGTPTVFECRGCSYGCVHDTRSFSSAYHGIRRAGF